MFQADDSDDDEGEEVSEVDLLQVRIKKCYITKKTDKFSTFAHKKTCIYVMQVTAIVLKIIALRFFYLLDLLTSYL